MEIKLRIWDIKKQKMYFIAKLDMWGSEDNWTVDLCDESADEQLFDVEISSDDLMRYTGLKDKNGCEIWEGDILKIVNNLNESTKKEWHFCEVIFKKEAAAFVSQQVNSVFYSHFDDYNVPVVTFEVVGNIYKNVEYIEFTGDVSHNRSHYEELQNFRKYGTPFPKWF